jgi:omega-amidase
MKKIALAQINIDYDSIDNNISKSLNFIENAIDNRCNVIIFPELWSTGFKLSHCAQFAAQNEIIIDKLHNLSSNNEIEIIGTYIIRRETRFYNQFVGVQPKNDSVIYEKINLFPALQEPKYLTSGNEIKVFESSIGQCGASICFDLRFNWIYEAEAKNGADVFLIPAHWPKERVHHWDVLLQSRAIEHLAFVVGVNSVGRSGNSIFGGHSSVISPDGEIIFQADDSSEGLYMVEIDPAQVHEVREKYSFIRK